MPRRFNYTSRKRILQEHVHIRIVQDDTGLSFDAELDLTGYGFEKQSPKPRVFIEAYRGATASWKRFDFGVFGEMSRPPDRSLSEFRTPEGILFRVRVTAADAAGAGRLVGEADSIRPRLPGEEDLPVQPLIQHLPSDDIGDEIWRVDFSGEMPLLKINSRLPMGVDQFLTDPRNRAVFAPAIMRHVLTRILLIEADDGDEEDEDDWRQRWLRFGTRMTGQNAPDVDPKDGRAEIEEWIDQGVEGFARRVGLKSLGEPGDNP